jgi:hypothetical protein
MSRKTVPVSQILVEAVTRFNFHNVGFHRRSFMKSLRITKTAIYHRLHSTLSIKQSLNGSCIYRVKMDNTEGHRVSVCLQTLVKIPRKAELIHILNLNFEGLGCVLEPPLLRLVRSTLLALTDLQRQYLYFPDPPVNNTSDVLSPVLR